jgi:ribosomal protein S18 acetylase RimI-like enzyme
MMVARTRRLPGDTAARADATFVTHATWVPERTPSMVARVDADLVLADSGLPCDTFNIVCRARLAGGWGLDRARDAVAHFRQVRRPFSWWVGPADEPTSLGSMLESLGLARAETELAMALPLEALPEGAPAAPGLDVRRVRTADELEVWAMLTASNWSPPDVHVVSFYRRAAPALLDPAAAQWLYLGSIDGEPVATGEATVQGGTVGLFNVATREAFRGRGIGSRMTWQPLRDAAAEGCDLGVLQAAAAGVGVYRRLGFERYGEITEYKPGGGFDDS